MSNSISFFPATQSLLQAAGGDQEFAGTDHGEGQAHKPTGGRGETSTGTEGHGREHVLRYYPSTVILNCKFTPV